MEREDNNRNRSSRFPPASRTYLDEDQKLKLWGLLIFGAIATAATTFAVLQLRRTIDSICAQLGRSQSQSQSSRRSFRSAFHEDAWRKYNSHLREEYEEQMERVERIRRMQRIFNRERNKHRRSYERWREYGAGAHQQQYDWYWNAETYFRDEYTQYRTAPRENSTCSLSHHYSVLGLDRSRKTPYTEAEIKTAFRAKAKEFHPDQNQDNKEAAEAKFKEVMTSYEAIKQERKNMQAFC
ncbi:uncharacterized protein LOC116213677 [Punica granatum]|uniref:Uncharacterized protein LOC116213677 n=1 Tax=Punica granatum TaxID=22663 RepID=A0A6P8EGM4_PUNGR|nr:uncharacterized protein LOC116213677 [Punica granatum]